MTSLLRLILILSPPAFALAAAVSGLWFGARSAVNVFRQMWREA